MPWLSWPKDGGVKMWNDLGIRSAKFVHFRTMVRFCKVLKIYWYVFNISWISCMFLHVLALLNSYYLLFVYSHELCHVRLAKAILLQRRLKALALLPCRSEAVPLALQQAGKKSQSCPQRCPKDVPASHKCNKRFSSCSWKSPSARQLHHWWWDMKIMKFEARRSSNTPVCCRHDQHLMDLPSRGPLVSHLLSPSRPSTTVPSTRHTFSSCKLMVLRTIRNFKRSETTMNNGKNSFLPINSLFTVHTDT